MSSFELYGGTDPREVPAYTIADASRYIFVPAATLRSWFMGRSYARQGERVASSRLISPAGKAGPHLSFLNLVEAHVLRALRTEHGISLAAVRTALETAEQQLGISRLLLSDQLLTGAGEMFIERYGALISLSRSGQFAMKHVLRAYLRRVTWDDKHIPIKLFPYLGSSDESGQKRIVIDPRRSFGCPTAVGSGVMTRVLVGRIDAGESVQEVAADYDIAPEDVEAAIVFEKAA